MIKLNTVIPVIFNQLRQSSSLVSIRGYQNKSGEQSNFGLVFHIDYTKALMKSLQILLKHQSNTVIQSDAKQELLSSIYDALNNNTQSKSAHAYDLIVDAEGKQINGVKYNNGAIHLFGFIVKKEVIIEGNYHEVNSKPLTIEKNKLRKLIPISKFRQFKLEEGKFQEINIEKLTLVEKHLLLELE